MQASVEEFDLESMKDSLGDDTVELPEEINVHWQSYNNHWDFTIKFISSYGAGFPRRWDVSTSVSMKRQSVRCQTEQFLISMIEATVKHGPLGTIHLLTR